MSKKPVISIITPVWNGIPYFKDCVASVLAQDFQDWEWIISDNGSTDGTREYLDTLTDPRIRIFKQDKNLGIFGNLNFLAKNAAAPISQMLCHDDFFIEPDSLGKIVSYWKSAPADLGVVRFNHEDVVQCALTAFQRKILRNIISPDDADLMFFIFGGSLTGNLSNVSLRTEFFQKFGPFKETLPFAGDFEFWSRLSRKVPISIQNDPVIHVRIHPLSASYYQNRKGELVSQASEIVGNLYENILKNYPKSHFALQLHGTINYDSLQRYIALKLLLKGDSAYLRELERVSESSAFLLSKGWRWLLFFLTLGGRLGRVYSARYLMHVYLQNKLEMQKQQLFV